MKLAENKKYSIFLEILSDYKKKHPDRFYIKENTIFLNQDISLFFDTRYENDDIEIPDIKGEGVTINLVRLNCNKLIFNAINIEALKIESGKIKKLQFNNPENSIINQFHYKNDLTTQEEDKNKKSLILTIPNNIFFKNIYIYNSGYLWDILDNNYLESLTLSLVHLKNINQYSNLKKIILNRARSSNIEDIENIDFSNMKKLKEIKYFVNTTGIKNININNLPYLEKVKITVSCEKSNIFIENLPSLKKIDFDNSKYHDPRKALINQVDLKNINSDFLSEVTILGYKIKNLETVYSDRLEFLEVGKNSTKNIICGENIFIFNDINNIKNNFKFSSNTDRKIYNMCEYISYKFKDDDNIKEFFKLRHSTQLMRKLFTNELNNITIGDLKTVNEKDKFGLEAISYCRTIDSLKTILKYTDYTINQNDMNKLISEPVISYYQNILIKEELKGSNNSNIEQDFKIKAQIKLKSQI